MIIVQHKLAIKASRIENYVLCFNRVKRITIRIPYLPSVINNKHDVTSQQCYFKNRIKGL